MATGPEHYTEAERLLKGCKNSHGALVIEDGTAEVLAAATVHALLANAAATALSDTHPNGEGMPERDFKEWKKAAGTPES
jgi:hypothetical protein